MPLHTMDLPSLTDIITATEQLLRPA
jgi:hypothetical protein